MIKMINPEEAVKLTSKELEKLGFLLMSSSKEKDTRYYSKRGLLHYKVRVSNHKDLKRNVDVINDIIFSDKTIINDIQYRAKKASELFDFEIRKIELNRKK